MDASYHSMKDLITTIRLNLEKLERGELQADALPGLVEESRELYERLVILRFKAMERSLLRTPESAPVVEQKEPEVQVSTPFKLNISNPAPVIVQTSILDPIEEKKEETPVVQVEEKIMETRIEPKAVEERMQVSTESSLNDKLSQAGQKVSLAEKLQKKPIADLRTAIGLNQKFLFMNDLFEGENTAYNEALVQLNSQSNLDDAKNLLLSYGTRYNWDLESESVIQFTDLVERRYA